jgi:hypothetical protein
MEFQYPDMSDLSSDIMGNDLPNKIHPQGTQSSSPDLVESWCARPDGRADLIPNDITLLGNPDRRSKQREQAVEKAKSIKQARRLMISGKSLEEALQYIESHFPYAETQQDPEVRSLYDDLGLLGRTHVDRSAYDTCMQMRDHLRECRNRLPDLQLKIADCSSCEKHMAGYCPKTSLKLVDTVEYTPELLSRFEHKLRQFGIIPVTGVIRSKEDIRSLSMNPRSNPVREYYAPTPEQSPKATSPEIARALLEADENLRKKARMEAERARNSQEVAPILRQVYAMVRSCRMDGKALAHEMIRRFDQETLQNCQVHITEMLSDARVWTGLIYYPGFFSSCREANLFVQKNHIGATYAMAVSGCKQSCVHSVNGMCTMLHMRILGRGEKIPARVISQRIDDLNSRGLISSTDAARYKRMEQEQYLKGLSCAVRACRSNPTSAISSTRVPSHEWAPLSGTRATAHLAAVEWAKGQLENGATTLKLKEMLSEKTSRDKAETIVSEAVYCLQAIRSSSVDDCLQTSYMFRPGCKLIASPKCYSCPYERTIGCAKLGLAYVDDDTGALLSDHEVSESAEIKSFFASPEMRVLVDPPKRESPQIDIADFGQDASMVLQPPKPLPRDSDPTGLEIYRGSYLDAVDVPDVQYAPGLDIEGMSDGMDIGSI